MSKSLLVVGGAGALGRGVISRFARASWAALSVDFAANEEAATSNFILPMGASALAQADAVLQAADERCGGKVDAVVCAAGGWAGGSIRDAETLTAITQMHAMNTESAVLAAHLASRLLAPGGLLVLTGAAAALGATPGMVAYGMSKAATHHLIASTAPELPPNASALAVLPITIDTPMNRKFMEDADFTTWTKVDDFASKILEWAEQPDARPPSGHLVQATTINNVTSWKDVGNPFLN